MVQMLKAPIIIINKQHYENCSLRTQTIIKTSSAIIKSKNRLSHTFSNQK